MEINMLLLFNYGRRKFVYRQRSATVEYIDGICPNSSYINCAL